MKICKIPDCRLPHYALGYCHRHWLKFRKYGDALAGKTYARRGEPLAWVLAHANYKAARCLKWPFATNTWGYGDFWAAGIHHRANRFMCRLVHGAAPTSKHEALHTCGNGHKGCVNPQHLRWGTSKD